jgi:hypothetical protein
LRCGTRATNARISSIVYVRRGKITSKMVRNCDTVSAGAFFPQAQLEPPRKEIESMEMLGISDALRYNWLQVLDTTELAQVDYRIPQQLHPIVSLLDVFKAEQ